MQKLISLFLILLFYQISIAQNRDSTNLSETLNLDKKALIAYKEVTTQQLNSLSNYLQLIASKETSLDDLEIYIRSAIDLFIPKSVIEVSNLRYAKKTYPIESYFHHLSGLNYTKIDINFYNVSYLGNFHQGTDGNYYATASIFQEFIAYNGDYIVYKDRSKKDITVCLKWEKDPIYKKHRWILLFEDIKVVETKA